MIKRYNLEPGYITIPEANQIVLRMLSVVNKDDKSHYNKLLNGAKKGLFGGKKHGTRMYQVRKNDIIQYAEDYLHKEKLKLFNIELSSDIAEIDRQTLELDNNTATKLYYYLKTLRFHNLISNEVFQHSEKKLILRLNFGKLNQLVK